LGNDVTYQTVYLAKFLLKTFLSSQQTLSPFIRSKLRKGEGPIGLVVAPTRELADQISKEAKKFAKVHGIKCVGLTGGQSKWEQKKALFTTPEVIMSLHLQVQHLLYSILVQDNLVFALGNDVTSSTSQHHQHLQYNTIQ